MGQDPRVLKQVVEALPFVRSHSIEIVEAIDGVCKAKMKLDPQFSTPPSNFPAAMVGMLGDVAGITACISGMEPGQVCSTMDFTVKMTGIADGDVLEAEAEALNIGRSTATGQARIYSVKGESRRQCAVVLVTGRVMKL